MARELVYREIMKLDCKPIFELGREHFGSPKQYSWDWSISKVQDYANREYGSGIVCLNGKEIVGFALAQNKYSEQRPDVAWLTYVMVHPEYKGKGIGKTLTAKLIETLKDKGVREIITDVYENNTESLQFFERQGFEKKEKWFILARKLQ